MIKDEQSHKRPNNEPFYGNFRHAMIALAWVATLLASSLDVILWRELAGAVPYWLPWIHAIGLVTIFALTLIFPGLRRLKGFVLILLIIFFLGFGGGWQWGLIPFVRGTTTWISWEAQAPWALSAISTHLLRLSPALVILGFLMLSGKKRGDFFLAKGKINAPVEPSRLLGMKKTEPWTRIGTIFAVIFASVTLLYLTLASPPTLNSIEKALPLIPVALLIATINSFNEEFTLRAAPLSELWTTIGKQQALMITTLFFGLGHFYGVPSGILGVLLSSFLGWFLGKSMLETKGFFWAWLIHFLPDAFIFTFFAITIV
jgi:hypothetical protein